MENMHKQAQPKPTGFRAGIEKGPDGESTGTIICYPSTEPNCKVVTIPQPGSTSAGFLSMPEPMPFHDEVLMKATQQINEILWKVAQETQRDSRKTNLHLWFADEGPMLIWVDSMAMPVNGIRELAKMASW